MLPHRYFTHSVVVREALLQWHLTTSLMLIHSGKTKFVHVMHRFVIKPPEKYNHCCLSKMHYEAATDLISSWLIQIVLELFGLIKFLAQENQKEYMKYICNNLFDN